MTKPIKIVITIVVAWVIVLSSLAIVGKYIIQPELERRNDILQEQNDIEDSKLELQYRKACEERNRYLEEQGRIPFVLCN